MVKLTNLDFLSQVMKTKCDVEFQFVGFDDDETRTDYPKRKVDTTEKEKPGVYKGHKLLLSGISTVFDEQFFGSMHDRGLVVIVEGMEIVRIKEFSLQAFSACIDHEYGGENIVKTCTDHDLLFEMILVCKKYLLEELSQVIMRRILRIKISKENLFVILKVLEQFRGLLGFEKICADLNRMCLVATSRNFSSSMDVFKFWSNNRKIKDEVFIDSFLDQISEEKKWNCTNCDVEDCLDGKTVLSDNPKVGLKVRLSGSKDENLTGVITKAELELAEGVHDPWGGQFMDVDVKFKSGIEDEFHITINDSELSYHCRDYIDPVENEEACSNCHVESLCLAGKVFLPRKVPAVGTKVKLTGTERTGVISLGQVMDDKDKWGADQFEVDVEFQDDVKGSSGCSSNYSAFSYDC